MSRAPTQFKHGLFAAFVSVCFASSAVYAGGGPLNVMLLYNVDSPEAFELATHYQEARVIPSAQLCPVSGVSAHTLEIAFADYESLILTRLDECLANLKEATRIDYLVIARGLPYRVAIPNGFTTSLSAMLQVYRASSSVDGGLLAGRAQAKNSEGGFSPSIQNPMYLKHFGGGEAFQLKHAGSALYNAAVRIANSASQPITFYRVTAKDGGGYNFSGNLFLVTRLDGFDFEDARALVDRAIAAEEAAPIAPIMCMAAADEARGPRDPECHYVVGLLNGAGIAAEYIEKHDSKLAGKTVAAYLTGAANLKGAIDGNTYVAGAFLDNLTSFGAAPQNFVCGDDGQCPLDEKQTSIARAVRAGATAVHGTVNEPLSLSFPNAGALLLHTMGYNLVESLFFNQRFIYWQNTLLADPLLAPWAQRPTVTIEGDESAEAQSFTINASHPNGVMYLVVYVNGAYTEQSAGEPITVTVQGGAEARILAVATADNASVSRPGWPQPEQFPRPYVQGWRHRVVNKVAPEVPEVDDAEDSNGGCAWVRRGRRGGFWPMALILVLLFSRRWAPGRARRC